MKRAISTKKAPAAIGPYSQAVMTETGTRLAFLSGQIALDPATGQMATGGTEEETRQVMKNIEALLRELGADFDSVVKTTIFLKDFNDFAKVNEIYGSFFRKEPPARSTVEVSRLPKDARVEIECVVGL
jgi:2-iminobutanoate/2-iminopropanoate deaminase